MGGQKLKVGRFWRSYTRQKRLDACYSLLESVGGRGIRNGQYYGRFLVRLWPEAVQWLCVHACTRIGTRKFWSTAGTEAGLFPKVLYCSNTGTQVLSFFSLFFEDRGPGVSLCTHAAFAF